MPTEESNVAALAAKSAPTSAVGHSEAPAKSTTNSAAPGDRSGSNSVEQVVHARKLSFVLPAYNEAENLPKVIGRITAQAHLADEIEVIVVDDHSSDGTFEVVRQLADNDSRVRGLRLARNSGSHMALFAAVAAAKGDAVIALAADGQDPPEFAPELVQAWQGGAQVVWGVRAGREGESLATRAFSKLYYSTMNRWSDVRLPPAGADFMLLDRRVVDALMAIPERNTSILALITWLGFRQVELPYIKEARLSGRSKWTLRKKLKLVLDSLVGFSTLPLRLASTVGFVTAGFGFTYAAALIVNKLGDGFLFGTTEVQGWSALMVVVLVCSGIIMAILGIVGEYLWRALEEVRGRPRFQAEDEINIEGVTGDLAPPFLGRRPSGVHPQPHVAKAPSAD